MYRLLFQLEESTTHKGWGGETDSHDTLELRKVQDSSRRKGMRDKTGKVGGNMINYEGL